jgi:hypothetical protein
MIKTQKPYSYGLHDAFKTFEIITEAAAMMSLILSKASARISGRFP